MLALGRNELVKKNGAKETADSEEGSGLDNTVSFFLVDWPRSPARLHGAMPMMECILDSTYAEGLVNFGGLVVGVGVGGVGSCCSLQLSSHEGCPLSCDEHVGRCGQRSIEQSVVRVSWEEAAPISTR